MKKTNSLELLKWLLWTIISAYILGYLTVVTLDNIFIEVPKAFYTDIPVGFITIVFFIFFGRQLSRLDNHLPLKEKRELKATNARSIKVNGTHNMFLSSVGSIFGSEATQEPSQLLYWQYGSYTIREDTAYEWLRKGWCRQLLGEPHPFSCNWMTRQRFYTLGSQTIDRPYHEALCVLAIDYGLWLKIPTQGASGKILASPGACVAKLHGRWGN